MAEGSQGFEFPVTGVFLGMEVEDLTALPSAKWFQRWFGEDMGESEGVEKVGGGGEKQVNYL